MRDGNRPDWLGIQKKLNEDYNHIDPLVANAISEDELEKVYGGLVHEDEQPYSKVKPLEEVDHFIYGDLTHSLFCKMKKLKAMAIHSTNENESFLAYKLCHKLCNKHGLQYDKLPCWEESN
jgi:hypothetical protein